MPVQPLDFEKGCGFFTTTPATVGHFVINDYALNYEIHGTGNTKVFCIMGLMSSMAGWKEVLNYFLKGYDSKQHSSDYQFLVFDNRGVGHSTNGKFGRYTTSGMAQDAAKLLKHVGWTKDRSVHLCGISMGGMISLELASLIPDRFKSLNLLVTCASHRPTPGYFLHSELSLLKPTKTIDDKITVLMSLLFSDEDWLDGKDPRYPEYKSNRERVFETLKYRMQRTRAPGIYTFLGQGLAVKTHYVSKERLNHIGKEIPDCVAITGTNDVMIDPACTRELGDYLDCRTVFLEGKGHVIVSEADLETCKELELNFVSGEQRWAKL
ncbi:hypothetical protein HDV01_000726 [Terramyces sp. JEL0728]|nr:hypothetical protein HDV01_000726 [Terramyces sp. JEL0728]